MFDGLAVGRQVFPDPANLPPEAADPARAPWERRRARDEAALALLEADIERWAAEDRRYAALFLPQVGHGPWPGFPGDAERDVERRGRGLFAIQDAWIERLVALLRRLGRLDRTLIVFTADHGLRTREEDASFTGATIDACSFHVPFLLYAPGMVERTKELGWVTSHVDVVPTLLDLLGVEDGPGRSLEQGSPVWDPRLARRRTFFFANHFLGADGYHSGGDFYMWSHVTDGVYARRGEMRFGPRDLLPLGIRGRAEVIELLRRMTGLAQVWGAKGPADGGVT